MTVGIGIGNAVPDVLAGWSHVVLAVPLNAAPSHSDVRVHRMIGAVDRDAPELGLAQAGDDVATVARVRGGGCGQAVSLVLRVARVAPELACRIRGTRLVQLLFTVL